MGIGSSAIRKENGDIFTPGGRVDSKTGEYARFDKESLGRQPHRHDATAIAYDSRRNRLLVAIDKYLYGYDPEQKRWLWRKEIDLRLLGLAYHPTDDVFYGVFGDTGDFSEVMHRERLARAGIRRPDSANAGSTFSLLRISPEGEKGTAITISKELGLKPLPFEFQTAFADGVLILFSSIGQSVHVVRPETGQVVYTGEMARVDEREPALTQEPGESVPSAEGQRRRFQERLDALKQRLNQMEASAFQQRLDYLSRCAAGEFSKRQIFAQPEIHAVGLYRVDRPDEKSEAICPITVTHSAAPLILVFSAQERTTWKLDVAPDVRISQVVIAGTDPHRVEGVPSGVPVVNRTMHEQPEHYLYVASREESSGARHSFVSAAHAVFGSVPMTIQYDQSSYEIGPGSEKWQASYTESLSRDLERDLYVAENAELSFNALFRRRAGDKESTGLTEFSLKGPKRLPSDWLSEPSLISTASSEAGKSFVVTNKNEVFAIDEGGKKTDLRSPESAVLGRTTALTYDSRRDRLIAWHTREYRKGNGVSIHGRVLFAYDFHKHIWEPMGQAGVDIGSVAYDVKSDRMYGLVLPVHSNAIRALVRMNLNGAVLAATPLSTPITWDLFAGPPQVVLANGQLIAITPPQTVLLPEGKERLVAQVLAIDPRNGRTYLTGRYFCDED
jgi:hypothetical protein